MLYDSYLLYLDTFVSNNYKTRLYPRQELESDRNMEVIYASDYPYTILEVKSTHSVRVWVTAPDAKTHRNLREELYEMRIKQIISSEEEAVKRAYKCVLSSVCKTVVS